MSTVLQTFFKGLGCCCCVWQLILSLCSVILSLIVNQQSLSIIPFPYVEIKGVSRTRTINSFVNAKLLVLHRSRLAKTVQCNGVIDVVHMYLHGGTSQLQLYSTTAHAPASSVVSRFLVNWDAAVWKWAFSTHTQTLSHSTLLLPVSTPTQWCSWRHRAPVAAPVKSRKFRSFLDVA